MSRSAPTSAASSSPPPAKGRLRVSAPEVAEKFSKTMTHVALKEKETEAMRLAATAGHPHIDLDRFPVAPTALRQIQREDAERLKTVCFYYTQDEFRIGALNPNDPAIEELLYQLQERTKAHGVIYTISEHSFARVLKLYDTLPVVKPITKDVEIHPADLKKVETAVTNLQSFQSLIEKQSTTDLVTFMLGAAFKIGASDVHLEATEAGITLRFRLDGILQDAAKLPKEAYKKLISRLKLISSLKLNITDKPQDGRFTIKQPTGDVDVRVSTMPTVYGESVVMRLLHQTKEGLPLDKIGVYGDAFTKLQHEIERPNGMIITTGPTGSGKTTTLYAIMHLLNEPGVNIITLEDPVEYKMAGVNQSQIDIGKGYTFAKGLRSILRQDPDIAMVGEIRDLETADIAIQSALTGHLILSTIHTNSAAGAIPRFLSMGVKPFLLAPALNCVIGQRLVRLLCDQCKHEVTLSVEQNERVKNILAALPAPALPALAGKKEVFFDAEGCAACGGIGYKGRIGIYEIFTMSPEVEQLILTGQVSEYVIEQMAVKAGMITMVQDGILKALQGITSVAEVFRVIE